MLIGKRQSTLAHGCKCKYVLRCSGARAYCHRYAFDVIGEIFFGDMFGFLENSEDHGSFIASLDALMPVLCISAIGPTYLRPLIMGSAIVIPAAFKAVKAIDGIRKAAVAAAGKRMTEIENGVAHRSDMLQQLFDIVREKGEKVNFTSREATLEAYVAMSVLAFFPKGRNTDIKIGSPVLTLLPLLFGRYFIIWSVHIICQFIRH